MRIAQFLWYVCMLVLVGLVLGLTALILGGPSDALNRGRPIRLVFDFSNEVLPGIDVKNTHGSQISVGPVNVHGKQFLDFRISHREKQLIHLLSRHDGPIAEILMTNAVPAELVGVATERFRLRDAASKRVFPRYHIFPPGHYHLQAELHFWSEDKPK
ncbi:hypothetical protein Pan216_24820 [Planctomycetes bacterium Pan216]|uniref:Uncharacterized protein n=1 Tax=Kolteria novifilia TaxID=2527975 RepID=A0A518B3Q5_9BACT|nr:hypothetical protein Pan216_24820 [Planctomycetes bacterium Pan216]